MSPACRAHQEPGLSPAGFPVRAPARKIPEVRVAAAVLLDSRNRILITQRPLHGMLGGLWEFPGGKLHPGETPEQAVVRELREETGVQIRPEKFLLNVRHTYSHFHLNMDVFLCRLVKGRPRALECEACRWTMPDDWDGFAFSKADLKIIHFLRSGFSL